MRLPFSDVRKFTTDLRSLFITVYASYLVFQLFSHRELYEDRYQDEGGDVFRSARYPSGRTKLHAPKWLHVPGRRSPQAAASQSAEPLTPTGDKPAELEMGKIVSSPRIIDENDPTRTTSPRGSEAGSFSGHSGPDVEAQKHEEEEDEIETPMLSVPVTIGLLVVVTVLVAVTAEWLVDSIDGLTDSGHIKKEWVGLILLPIVGNAAEHVTAVTVSVKDKLTLSLGVAVGSSIVSIRRALSEYTANGLS